MPIKYKIRLLKAEILKNYRIFVIQKSYGERVLLPTPFPPAKIGLMEIRRHWQRTVKQRETQPKISFIEI